MKKTTLIILLCLGFIYTNAQVEDESLLDLSLEELLGLDLALGSRTIKNPDQVPGAITTIDKEQIKQMQARTLRDVLNVVVPGMDVVPTYFQFGNPVSEGIYSRGILSDFNQQILILFNGENKFNESTFGSPLTGLEFTLENVERIEINNSPAPLLGGSALVTINIVTKDPHLTGNEVFLNAGFNETDGFQSKRLTFNSGKYIKTWHLGASLQYSDDNGQLHPDTTGTGASGDLRDGTQDAINFQLNLRSPNEKLELGSWFKNVSRDAYFSNLNVSPNDQLYDYGISSFHNYLKYQATDALDFSFGASTFNYSNTFSLDRPIPVGVNQRLSVPFENTINNYNYYLKGGYLKDFDLLGAQTLFAGFKIEREGQSDHSQSQFSAETNRFEDVTEEQRQAFAIDLPDDDRTVYSLFAENNWNITNKLSFLYGFRWDYYENFKNNEISAFNPRLAFAYLPSDEWIIRALYSSAVRPPSLYEVEGNNFLPQLYGNEDLTFERLSTIELSLKFKRSGFEINLNPYYEQFIDRITYVPSELDNSAFVATNQGEVEVLGLEFNTRYTWGKSNYAFFNGSRLRSEDKLSDETTTFIPALYLNGGFNVLVGKLNLNLTGFYRGRRELPEALVFNREKAQKAQFMTSLATTYEVQDGLSFYVLVENLFDSSYFIPLSRDGFNVPLRSRTINVGLNLKF